MALVPSAMAAGLSALAPTMSEGAVIEAISSAWRTYFALSAIGAAPAVAAAFEPGIAAMKGALIGISAPSPGIAAVKIQAGVLAFWGAIVTLPTTIWITAPIVLIPPIVPPVGISGIAAALNGIFANNMNTLPSAANSIAGVLHSSGGLGALVPGSVPPAPPAPLPII